VSPGARLAAAFRRLGAVVGVRSTRRDDRARLDRHGAPIGEIDRRMAAFAAEIEARAAARRPD
jgi:hypothetical protein